MQLKEKLPRIISTYNVESTAAPATTPMSGFLPHPRVRFEFWICSLFLCHMIRMGEDIEVNCAYIVLGRK